jgi:hypothetical protein
MRRVLVEWNRLLFDTFIPITWAKLLFFLLKNDSLTDVFSLWPPSQLSSGGRSSLDWKDLPRCMLRQVDLEQLEIWPTFGSQTDFCALSTVLIAPDMDHHGLESLCAAGLKITLPPRHIRDLIQTAGIEHTCLEPEAAYHALLVRTLYIYFASTPSFVLATDCFHHIAFPSAQR